MLYYGNAITCSGKILVFGIPREVFRDLLKHYQSAGINATLLDKKSSETIAGETAIKIEGRNFDLVVLKFARGSMAVGRGGGFGPSISKKVTKTHPVINFHHIIKGLDKRNEDDLKAEMKEEKKGFLSKKLVNVSWQGGKLAKKLNEDTELKNMILKTQTTSLKVEPDTKNNCIRIIHQKKIDMIVESGGVFLKKTETRAENFPSIKTLDIIDRIAEYAKAL